MYVIIGNKVYTHSADKIPHYKDLIRKVLDCLIALTGKSPYPYRPANTMWVHPS